MDGKEKFKAMFASNVFNEATMRERLSPASYKAWKKCLEEDKSLDINTANEIAEAMKNWAIDKGATHYSHWFQPLTGATAEKHDAFIAMENDGRVVMDFTGKNLVKGEPDASSFPSGGLRATFEARGYTAWDPTSFAFVKDHSLYIPTIFCSYSGEALDKKTPLLRSMDLVSRQALRILRLFGDTTTRRVIAQCGAEQEFFLIDKELYKQREDLRITGRTLFGSMPPRSQEADDHYFGQMPSRVKAFMQEMDEELWKLGVLSKTKHNEAAPAQYEMALSYSDANSAADANQLVMELLRKVAGKYGFVCLLHEKPFARVNGSGKHDNWSLATDGGDNLYKPGSTPSQNARFLLFLAAFIKGVDDYQELLRATVASAPGNEMRLGGMEAPPAVLSIFLGDELFEVVESIIKGTAYEDSGKRSLRVGIDVMPQIPQDNTDRNRTSPMAFTGNKFEFRMVGSSQSVSGPNIAINTIVAQELREFADILEKSENFQEDLQVLLKKVFTEHSRILFNGNGYDDAWLEEAERRGLPNLKTAAEALPHYTSEKSIGLFESNHIYSRQELIARGNVHVSNYIHIVEMEARTMLDMIGSQILPACSAYAAELCSRAADKQKFGIVSRFEIETAKAVSELNETLADAYKKLSDDLAAAPEAADAAMPYICDVIRADMAAARDAADQLEVLVDRKFWPFPVYTDMMFSE